MFLFGRGNTRGSDGVSVDIKPTPKTDVVIRRCALWLGLKAIVGSRQELAIKAIEDNIYALSAAVDSPDRGCDRLPIFEIEVSRICYPGSLSSSSNVERTDLDDISRLKQHANRMQRLFGRVSQRISIPASSLRVIHRWPGEAANQFPR
jgi:hypothetical protein